MTQFDAALPNTSFKKALLHFCLLLVLAQVVRAFIAWLLMGLAGIPGSIGQPVSLMLMAAVVWLVVRPSWQDLGLDLRAASKGNRWLYAVMAAIVLMLVAANLLLDSSLWLTNLYGVILVPIIEEALFRGLGWNRLSKALPERWNGFRIWFIISILFGLWHLGYADVIHWYADSPVSLAALPQVMVWKVLVGGFIGGAAGLARWKFKDLPGAVFVHAIFNIFGR